VPLPLQLLLLLLPPPPPPLLLRLLLMMTSRQTMAPQDLESARVKHSSLTLRCAALV
jgi:hypothetical protein